MPRTRINAGYQVKPNSVTKEKLQPQVQASLTKIVYNNELEENNEKQKENDKNS